MRDRREGEVGSVTLTLTYSPGQLGLGSAEVVRRHQPMPGIVRAFGRCVCGTHRRITDMTVPQRSEAEMEVLGFVAAGVVTLTVILYGLFNDSA